MFGQLSRRELLRAGVVAGVGGLAGCAADDGDEGALDEEETGADVVVYWFWGDGCPVCADQRSFIESLDDQDDVDVVALEVFNDDANQQRFGEFIDAYGIQQEAVPTIVVGDSYWVGDSSAIRSAIESKVDSCRETECEILVS